MLHVHGWHLDVSVCRGRVRGLGLPWTGGQSAALNYFCDETVLSRRPESTGAGCLPLPLLTIQCAVCTAAVPIEALQMTYWHLGLLGVLPVVCLCVQLCVMRAWVLQPLLMHMD